MIAPFTNTVIRSASVNTTFPNRVGLTVWLAKANYVLIPALILCLALIAFGLYRRRQPLQWIIIALVKALNAVAIEAFITDLHPCTLRARGRKFLDGEPDRLCCSRKTAIAQRLSRPVLALGHE
jgi:hypothetical protein